MPRETDRVDRDGRVCQWKTQSDALREFAKFMGRTESAAHIKPLHWYVACRLVIEGGFHPDDIVPRPPFAVSDRKGERYLLFDPKLGKGGERTILGGLKTKNVDVVVTKDGIGPVLAVSCKGVTKAFRNLTNRMEETIGECTNLHITYPALVVGYLVVIRANRLTEKSAEIASLEKTSSSAELAANDIAIHKGGEPVEGIIKFHAALTEMSGRRGIRNELSRYEAIALAMIDMDHQRSGTMLSSFPPSDSPLRLEHFFSTLYLRYDERYVYSAPLLKSATERLEWSRRSEAFDLTRNGIKPDYDPRYADDV